MTSIELVFEDPDATPDRHLTRWQIYREGAVFNVGASISGAIAAEYRNGGHDATELVGRYLRDLFSDPTLDARRYGERIELDLGRSDLDPFRS